MGVGEGVGKAVGVFAIGRDDDLHGGGEAGELAGARAWNNDDIELIGAMLHGGIVLEDKGAGAATK